MATENISPDLVRIALDKVEGFPFERFVNDFYPAIVGRTCVPLGGVKDGGADGFQEPVHEDSSKASVFYQASVGVEVENKIRATVTRLRGFGRDPKTLTYVTSRSVKFTDTIEEALTTELDVTIRIRDASYLISHISDGDQTKAAYIHHLRYLTDYLKSVGSSQLITASRHVRDPTVFVFLSQELERRKGDQSIVASVIDSLIMWALEDTDPEKNLFMTEEQIADRITDTLPSVQQLVGPRLRKRLMKLTSKTNPVGRQVRWHKADDRFCLPYETRRKIESENRDDENLKIEVLKSIEDRVLSVHREGLGTEGIRTATELAMRALQLTF